MTKTVESLVAYCRENRRVCPQPTLWNELWQMLPNRRRIGSGWEPPLPLILAAWHGMRRKRAGLIAEQDGFRDLQFKPGRRQAGEAEGCGDRLIQIRR